MPKYHRYIGTAVSVSTNVPIRNELVVQLMRSAGIRKITKKNLLKPVTDYELSTRDCSAENYVLLRPGMNLTAVRTCKLLRFHFGCLPALFFDCLSLVG